jgi:hypothetical protein
VDPVGQLHQQDPDVLGHGQDHLADVFGLLGGFVAERSAGRFGHPVDNVGDLFPEILVQVVQAGVGVLHRVVEEAAGNGDGPETHLGQEVGHFQGVGQVGFAGQAYLAFVGFGRKDVGFLITGVRLRVVLEDFFSMSWRRMILVMEFLVYQVLDIREQAGPDRPWSPLGTRR